VNNDESKQRLHEQQVRFVEEVNTLVKSLERVESHAKGLTQNNMDLRLQLKQAQDEALTWKRKFSKIEGTKDSMVRQMEAAILQRTQALKSTMSGAEGNEMSAMMDQITRMQEEKFEFNEIIAKLRREVLDEKVKTQKAEETIKSMGEDMVDLRQAAGPTADLIANLKEQVEIAKRGELQLRKDLHAAKNQIKRLNGGVVEAGDDLPVVFERGIQCVLIGNTSSEEGPYVCASCGGKGDAGGGEKTDAKETKAEEGSKKAAPKVPHRRRLGRIQRGGAWGVRWIVSCDTLDFDNLPPPSPPSLLSALTACLSVFVRVQVRARGCVGVRVCTCMFVGLYMIGFARACVGDNRRRDGSGDGRQRQDQVHGKKNQVAQDASGIPVLFFSAIICMCILSHRLFCAIPSCDDTPVTVRAALPAPHASTHKVVCALVIYSPFSAVTGQVELGAGGTQKGSKRQGNADCRANEHNQRVCCHH